MTDLTPKSVLVTGANGYIGNATARAFVRAGWTTYGLVRQESLLPSLKAEEIIPILGSPADQTFIASLDLSVVFDVIVSTTEEIMNYVPHYNEVVSLLDVLAKRNQSHRKKKPLVLFTSGCKDYGMMDEMSDSPGLQPHIEESPIAPPPFALNRATHAIKIFEHACLFDAVLLRPTNVYGLASSYYGDFLRLAKEGKERGVLEFSENPKTILHALHVDDCGEAYVALAEFPHREKLNGQCFNISSYRFETLEEIAQALVREYNIQNGVKWLPVPQGRADVDFARRLIRFSQWTGSDKLRELTGWKDRRVLFSKGLKQYRLAYEAAITRPESRR
ncbi:hypothetical protein V499_07243 [Pseudogymnoascus sp. VKM F-103]|nr:hypothetical protein V499_07243 [Pseudogymnoascus sp. VKM F-103]